MYTLAHLEQVLDITSELFARSSKLRKEANELIQKQSSLEGSLDEGILKLLDFEEILKTLMREAIDMRQFRPAKGGAAQSGIVLGIDRRRVPHFAMSTAMLLGCETDFQSSRMCAGVGRCREMDPGQSRRDFGETRLAVERSVTAGEHRST